MMTLAYHQLFGFHLDPRLPFYSDVGFHRGDSFSGGPSKELPSRINRQRRSAERRELSQALHRDLSTSSPSSSTKCAATQTIISTVRHETNEFVGIPSLNPAFPPPSSSSLLSHIPLSSAPIHPAFILDMRQQSRPSVINKAPSTPKEHQERRENDLVVIGDRETRRNGIRNSRLENFHSTDVTGKPSEVCDEIEEHFRRSLGENYPEEKSSEIGSPSRSPIEVMPPTPPGSASLPKGSAPVSITGTVDDHFAKALGDKWSRIKTEMEPAANNNPASPPNTPSPAALTSQVFKHASFVSS